MKFKGTIIITDPCYIMPETGDDKVRFTDFLPASVASKKFTDFTQEENEKYQAYIKAREEALEKYPDYWRNGEFDVFESGAGLEKFGFTNWIWEDTIYGDWSCTTFELKDESVNKPIEDISQEDIKGILGDFCADAGLVGVFLLDEVLAFNPEFDYHTERKWTTTLIEDFDGEIEYEVVDDEAFIRGTGNINFITRQTGF